MYYIRSKQHKCTDSTNVERSQKGSKRAYFDIFEKRQQKCDQEMSQCQLVKISKWLDKPLINDRCSHTDRHTYDYPQS